MEDLKVSARFCSEFLAQVSDRAISYRMQRFNCASASDYVCVTQC